MVQPRSASQSLKTSFPRGHGTGSGSSSLLTCRSQASHLLRLQSRCGHAVDKCEGSVEESMAGSGCSASVHHTGPQSAARPTQGAVIVHRDFESVQASTRGSATGGEDHTSIGAVKVNLKTQVHAHQAAGMREAWGRRMFKSCQDFAGAEFAEQP